MSSEQYCLVQDDAGHWFVVPVTKAETFDLLVEQGLQDFPPWAVAVGGHPRLVKFVDFVVC